MADFRLRFRRPVATSRGRTRTCFTRGRHPIPEPAPADAAALPFDASRPILGDRAPTGQQRRL